VGGFSQSERPGRCPTDALRVSGMRPTPLDYCACCMWQAFAEQMQEIRACTARDLDGCLNKAGS